MSYPGFGERRRIYWFLIIPISSSSREIEGDILQGPTAQAQQHFLHSGQGAKPNSQKELAVDAMSGGCRIPDSQRTFSPLLPWPVGWELPGTCRG